MASVTRKSLAEQRQWAGKQDAKEYLRASLGALANVDLQNDDSEQSRAALLEAGRSFKDMVQALYKQRGVGNSAQESEEKMFIRCLQQWTPPNSPDAPVAANRSTFVKVKGKRSLDELGSVSLSNVKQIRDLALAFPDWTFEISFPKHLGDNNWRKKGVQGSLGLDVDSMSEEAVAAVSEVIFLALYFSESFHRDGGGTGDLRAADKYKDFVQVCTILTALAAFSDARRLTVGGWSPESRLASAEQQAIDALATLLEEASLAFSHEQQIKGTVICGRMEVVVIEERDEWARHRGNAEVKKHLGNEYNGILQCIGSMIAQVEENWSLDDEADARPGKRRRASDGETIIVQGESAEAGPPASASSEGMQEGPMIPSRKETVFGILTDSRNWLVLQLHAKQDADRKVQAKVTSSGFFHWRREGTMGLTGLIKVLCAVMLPEIEDEDEWIRRAVLIKEAMKAHALEALEESKLGETQAAKALKVVRSTDAELKALRAANEDLKAKLASLEAAKKD